MATKEPTTVTKEVQEAPERKVNGKVTNPRNIEWPHDDYGFTSMLRKEGVRAVGRIKGDKAKLAVLIETCRVIAQHAETKFEDQCKEKAQAEAAQKNIEKAAYARSKADAEREVSRLQGLLKAAQATLDSKMGKTKEAE